MPERDDWSGRLTRLKFEMMASALLLLAFAFASQHIHTSIIFPFDLEGIGQFWLFVLTFFFYCYTTFHFVVRYHSELPRIHDLFDRTDEILRRMEEAKIEIRGAADTVDMGALSDALQNLRTSGAALENAIDKSAEGYAAVELQFMRIFEAYSAQNSHKDRAHLLSDVGRKLQTAKEQWRESAGVPALENMKRDMEDLSSIADRHERAISEGIPEAVAKANDELRGAVDDLRRLQSDFSRGRNTAGLDRVWLASIIPGIISVIMVVAASIKFAIDRAWLTC